MISFRDVHTPEDAAAWAAYLNTRRPERHDVAQHISQQIKMLPFSKPHVVELCPGAGMLAEVLLTEIPELRYTGLDFSEPVLAFAQSRLAQFGQRAQLIQADLNAAGWPNLLPKESQAIVSMQSLHDLGGEAEVNRIYGMARGLLVPGGLLLNADLITPPGQDNPDNPGRRSIPRHLELLQSHGYERVACTLEVGDFGCCVAFVPGINPISK